MKFIVSALIAVASATEWQKDIGGFAGLPDKDAINIDIDTYFSGGNGLSGFEAGRGGLSGFDAGSGIKNFDAGRAKGSLGELGDINSGFS